MSTRFAARLASRGLVQVSGPDAANFLHGLVTNDVHALSRAPATPAAAASAAAFLNGRGRLLFGTLMLHTHHYRYILDLPAANVPALIKHLTQYRLRAKVDISDITPDHSVWAIVGATPADAIHAHLPDSATVFDDPRLPALGQRAFLPPDFPPFHHLPQVHEAHFTRLRLSHGVPDDADFDHTPLPLDLGLHLLNGVSFNKGCYLGQELTARSHFTGVLRKRITPVAVVPEHDDDDDRHPATIPDATSADATPSLLAALLSSHEAHRLTKGAKVIIPGRTKPGGTVTSCVDNLGLAVLRLSDAFQGMQTARLSLEDGRRVVAWRPAWWAAGAEAVSSPQQ